jgi:YD repeat-containing protein
MKTFVQSRGNGMTFEYYANSRVFLEYNTLGETNTFTYNELRRETVMINARGNTRRFFFNADGNPVQTNEENGGVTTKTCDTTNPYLLQSEKNTLGYVTSYTYDANGNTTRQTLPFGATIGFSNYNAFGSPGMIKDALGNYTILKYDARGNLLQKIALRAGVGAAVTDPQNYLPAAAEIVSRTINTFDAGGNVLTGRQVRDFGASGGPMLSYGYNDSTNGVNGLNATSIMRTGDRDGNSATNETDTANLTYDTLGRIVTGINGNWYDTRFQYDVLGRVSQYKDGLGKLHSNTYDANNNLTKTWLLNSPIADVQTFGYDNADRKIHAVYNARGVTTYQYDAGGNVIKVTNPDAYTLNIEYDANDQPVRAYDQKGNKVDSVRDLAGKLRSITDPNGNTVTRTYYDGSRNGWLKSSTDAVGRITRYDYDAAGNVTSVTNNKGGVTRTTYDELQRPVREAGPVLASGVRPVKTFSYSPLGYLTSVRIGQTDASGTNAASDTLSWQMTYSYDDYGHLLSKTDGLGKTWRYAYDLFGNVLSATDPKNQVVNYTWGYGGQLLSLSAPDNVTTYTRNDLGQVKVAASPNVTYSYTYDNEQRVAIVKDSRGNKTLSYDYSMGGLLNRITESDGRATNYVYDPVGRLTQVWAPSNDSIGLTYDAGGRRLEKHYSNGALASFSYHKDNTLRQLVNRSGAAIVSQHDYSYDELGNRTSHIERVGAADAGRTYQYSYDALSRLTAVNRAGAPSSVFTYDILNNRTTKTEDGATLYYTYDAVNRLTDIRTGAAAPGGTVQTTLLYDPNGNMSSRADGAVSSTLRTALNERPDIRKQLHLKPKQKMTCKPGGVHIRNIIAPYVSHRISHRTGSGYLSRVLKIAR